MAYELYCAHVLGHKHLLAGLPCEDFSACLDGGRYKAFAVADGHGDAACLRSAVGAELACKVATETLEEYAHIIDECGVDMIGDPLRAERIAKSITSFILGKWLALVEEDYRANPLDNYEIVTSLIGTTGYTEGTDIKKMYGTTLIAGVVTDRYLFLIRLGDGGCAVLGTDCNFSYPLPLSWNFDGNFTMSLCDNDAAERFTYAVIDLEETPVMAVFAGTDGVGSGFSFDKNSIHSYFRDLLKIACEYGVPSMEEYLQSSLEKLSRIEGADDISLSGFIDVDTVALHLSELIRAERMLEVQLEINRLDAKIMSILDGGKMEYLESRYKDALEAYDDATKVFTEVENRYSEIMASLELDSFDEEAAVIPPELVLMIDELEQELEESEISLWEAKDALDKAEAEYRTHAENLEQLRRVKDELESEIREYTI